jgi:hypothetical protein
MGHGGNQVPLGIVGDTLVPLSTTSCDFSQYVIAAWALGAKVSKRIEVMRIVKVVQMEKFLASFLIFASVFVFGSDMII